MNPASPSPYFITKPHFLDKGYALQEITRVGQFIEHQRKTTMSKGQSAGKKRPGLFWRRMLLHSGISLGILVFSLVLGIWGYQHYEQLPWRDAFLNAAMLLGGMGPVKTDLSEPGKVFAGFYALYAGLVVIAVAGLLLAPGVHHLMHHV